MKRTRQRAVAAALAAIASLSAVQTHADLFKLDFGTPADSAAGIALTNWNTTPNWAFGDFPDGIPIFPLTDFSPDNNTHATLTILGNPALDAQLGAPPLQAVDHVVDWGNGSGLPDAIYDGVPIPVVVRQDYGYWYSALGDFAGKETLLRFANLTPGRYNVTVFEGRISDDNGQYGKVWVDDVSGQKEPADQNTGDFSGTHLEGGVRVPDPQGNPRTIAVDIRAGDYLWYAHTEDGVGGISGMIIRSVAPLVDSDGDGLPDYWETQYGLNPNDATDAAQDLNGNGISNLLEYQLGLDPTDKTAPTILSAVADAVEQTVTVTFSKAPFRGPVFPNDPRDATLATDPANYSISPALAITGVSVKGNAVTLAIGNPIGHATPYTLTVNNVRDVNNRPVATGTQTAIAVLPRPAGALAQRYRWITLAGEPGKLGSDDGTNSAARFNWPWGIALDNTGNLFITGGADNNIRKLARVGTNWVATTIAGLGGQSGSDDGTNSTARFNFPQGIAVDPAGNLLVADTGNNIIRKITRVGNDWITTTIAGMAGTDGNGSADGTNTAARFHGPADISIDKTGNLFVTDSLNNTIRKLTPVGNDWVTTTILGTAGTSGTADGTNAMARFNLGTDVNSSVVPDNAGHLYVSDYANQTIRKVTQQGTNWVVTTIAGKAGWPGAGNGTNGDMRFTWPNGLALDASGSLYVSMVGYQVVRKLVPVGDDWVGITIGGRSATPLSADGTGGNARFHVPALLKVDSQGNVYVADSANGTIRMGIPLLPVVQGVKAAGSRVDLTWSAAPGQTVQLQYSTDLSSTTWTDLGARLVATGDRLSASDTPAPDQPRYYRVIVLP